MSPHFKAVEYGAAVSIGALGISLVNVVPIAQLIAACVGIVAGVCAIATYFKRK